MKLSLSRRAKHAAVRIVEALESRCLLSISMGGTIGSQQVNPDGTATMITLGSFLNDPQLTGETVVVMTTPEGNIPLQLTDSVTPMTVSNFVHYIMNGQYTPTIVQRSQTNFVIQGGQFTVTNGAVTENTPDTTLQSEASQHNVAGTIAMALSTGPNSGTNQWFINVGDNSSGLDGTSNGGPFTVFGRVIDNGMTVVNAINNLTTVQNGINGGVPVVNYSGPDVAITQIPPANLVTDNIMKIDPSQTITYTASVANPALMTASIANGVLSLTAVPGVTSGNTNVTVTGTDLSGQSMSETFAAALTNGSATDVTIGAGGAKSVNYLDTNGTNATLSLKGAGTAVVHFTGTGLNPVLTRKNTIILSSTTAAISGIDFTNTNNTSNFTVTTKHGTINIGTISTAAIHSISGKGVLLTGDVNASGAIGMLNVAGASGGTINAPALGNVNFTGGFSDNVTLSGSGAVLGKFTAGAITAGNWNVTGSINSLTTKGISGWTAALGDVKNLTVRGALSGTISAGAIKNINVTGTVTATISANSIGSFTVHGGVTGSTISTNGAGVNLSRVNVSGAISTTNITSTGSIGTVMAGALDQSHIYAGLSSNVGSGQPLPNMITDFLTNQSITMVRLRSSRASVSFSNSDIAASTLGKLFLGTILTNNGGQVTGVAAQSLGLFNAFADGKQTVLKNLPSTVNFEDFIVKLF